MIGQSRGRGELVTYNPNVPNRLEVISRVPVDVVMDTTPFGKGGVREAYHLTLPGTVSKRLVAKKYSWKDASSFEQNYLEDFICYNVSASYAQRFNQQHPPNTTDYTSFHKVLHFNGVDYAIEDLLEGEFVKHNNIFGWLESDRRTPQAFSHFSFVASAGQEIVLDVQGVTLPDGSYKFTDPAMVSLTGKYGYTDPGIKSIYDFFKSHKCNDVCRAIGLPPMDLNHIGQMLPYARQVIRQSRNTAAHQQFCDGSDEHAHNMHGAVGSTPIPAPVIHGGSSGAYMSAQEVSYPPGAAPHPPVPPPVRVAPVAAYNSSASPGVAVAPGPPASTGGGPLPTAQAGVPADPVMVPTSSAQAAGPPAVSLAQGLTSGKGSASAARRKEAPRVAPSDDYREKIRAVERLLDEGSISHDQASRRLDDLRRGRAEALQRSSLRAVDDVIPSALRDSVQGGQQIVAYQIALDFKTKTWDAAAALVQSLSSPFHRTSNHELYRLRNFNKPWGSGDFCAKRRRGGARGDDVGGMMVQVEDQATCIFLANEFNRNGVPKPVEFLELSLLVIPNGGGGGGTAAGTPYLFGPYLDGTMDTYSSIARAHKDDRNTPQAFSHFSYAVTDGRLLVADMKGVGDRYVRGRVYYTSSGDGRAAVDTFFRVHTCNSICRGLRLPPREVTDAVLDRHGDSYDAP